MKFTPRVICLGHAVPLKKLLAGEQPTCGTVELTEAEYEYQLMRCDVGWHCPRCKAPAEWDDDCDTGGSVIDDVVHEDFLGEFIAKDSELADEEIPF